MEVALTKDKMHLRNTEEKLEEEMVNKLVLLPGFLDIARTKKNKSQERATSEHYDQGDFNHNYFNFYQVRAGG